MKSIKKSEYYLKLYTIEKIKYLFNSNCWEGDEKVFIFKQ